MRNADNDAALAIETERYINLKPVAQKSDKKKLHKKSRKNFPQKCKSPDPIPYINFETKQGAHERYLSELP